MTKITAELFSTLDGVVSAPEEWHGPYFTEEMGARTGELIAASGVMLLGRRTYEMHAGYWPTADDPMAELMNSIPKLVVTWTLETFDWENSSALKGTVADLKAEGGPDILITGSVALVQSLLREALIDELRLIVDPLVAVEGTRLFQGYDGPHGLRLLDSHPFSTGALSLTYGW
ncbi:dihydrofolate reductase family protein [Nonomuraea sp. NPDC050536]|uniref:dihydrofolate reductase family protein n=1 Tax=Nonomuraea sp. NPDC050536 TaxID=3364366 RepID=UPI0037C9609E